MGANNYNEIIKDLVSCNGCNIFHAIANPQLPEEFWPETIEKNREHQCIEGYYSKFIESARFIIYSSLIVLNLQNNTKEFIGSCNFEF